MDSIHQKVSAIREYVNHPWKREVIFSNRVKWDKVCASMDVLNDSQLAIDSFFALEEFSARDGGYLFLYGLLQAFFMQQDAANHLSEGLFGTAIKWASEYPDLYLVRELRNDAIGHPTKRGNDDSFHYISTYGLSKQKFSLASYYPKKQTSEYKDVDLADLRKKHEKSIGQLLDKTIDSMDKDLKDHKNKFKNMKLTDLVPNDHGYAVGKVFEGIHNNYPLAAMNFSRLQKTLEDIVAEIDKRYVSYTALPGVEDVVNTIKYILSRLDGWIENDELHENKDAEVFLDGYRDRFKELVGMLKEIDEDLEG